MMRKGLACAFLSFFTAVILFASASTASAAPPDLPDGLKIGGMEVKAAERSDGVTKLILEPKPGSKVAAQQVVCYVYDIGPFSPDGTFVQFSIDIFCTEVVEELVIEMTMVMYFAGSGYFEVPGAYNLCGDVNTSELSCTSYSSTCYFAERYWGIANLQGRYGGVTYPAYLETDAQQVACAV